MNTPSLLTGLGCMAASLLMFRMARQESANRKRASELRLKPIRDVKNGLCLTEGMIEDGTTIETPYTGTASVWYRYSATKRQKRQGSQKLEDVVIASGVRSCPFVLKDATGRIEVVPDGGTVAAYPHQRTLKSQSGKNASIADRVKKLKAQDRQNHPEGEKKPFFRKIESEPEPLDIPDDLEELAPGSPEIRNTHKKYYEQWVQPGDRVFVMGTVASGGRNTPLKIEKNGKTGPLFLSTTAEDLTAGAFGKNAMVAVLASGAFGIVGMVLILMGLGVITI